MPTLADACLFLYSDGLYEIRKGDGSAYGYEEFATDMGVPSVPPQAPMEAGITRAERLAAGRGYDDVSVLEVNFP